MKIGDKVSFLSEVGGGKIAGFQGKNIVLVEDEDGFQIPMPVNEVVVVTSSDYSTAKVINHSAETLERKAQQTTLNPGGRSVKAMMQDGQDEVVDMTVEDVVDDTKEITFRPQVTERKGGNMLSCYLAFVPDDPKKLVDNPRFSAYLVNDSNYYLQFSYLEAEGNSWTMRSQGELEPNTKLLLEELGREEINHLNRVAVQLLAYKRDKPFILKPVVDVKLRLDPIKFYKTHAMAETDFFSTPCLLYTIVENDRMSQQLVVDANELRKGMYAQPQPQQARAAASHDVAQDLVERYSANERKGGRGAMPFVRHRGLDDAMVVDLHAEEILDTTRGMKPGEILEYQLKVFRETMERYAGKKGQKIVFIHGKGEGVLRHAIVNDLKYRYKKSTYQDASFQEYGYGATLVRIGG